ncbi:MAG TPA: polyphenol oxidase family protein [Solirubrobacteraceae bacterium]|nr:polyphenol oxidase family protein [Solirubrobacteraceae bacterium]
MASTTTALPTPFTWAGDHVAIELPHGVHALFTTRRGGVSKPPYDSLNLGRWTDDEPAAIEENRARVLALTGAERFAFGRQVHGATVVRDGDEVVEADAQIVTRAGVAPMALTADCLPVALAGPDAVGMVHAGWRGLAAGILEAASAGFTAAAIGPCARGCCYEVGDEVREALGLESIGGPAPIDLPALARQRLRAAGVDEVHDSGLCTMCSEPTLFFSHRRDGGRTGRQAGVAWR